MYGTNIKYYRVRQTCAIRPFLIIIVGLVRLPSMNFELMVLNMDHIRYLPVQISVARIRRQIAPRQYIEHMFEWEFFFQVNFYVSTGPRKVVQIVFGFESSLQKRVNNAVPNVVAPLVYLLKKLPPYIGSLLRPPPRPIPSSFSYTMASSTSSPD